MKPHSSLLEGDFPPLNEDQTAKGMDQKKPPNAPIATTLAKVISSEFGIPKIGPNNGIIDVKNATGMRILRLTSGHSANFHSRLTEYAESTDNENQPPHKTGNEPGSSSGRMNTIRISIASVAPVAAPERMMCFQFMYGPNSQSL